MYLTWGCSIFEVQNKGNTMRKLQIGMNRLTEVFAIDEPHATNNSNHLYRVRSKGQDQTLFADITFQNGPVKEAGINGLHNEDLIAVVIDRLQGFQDGKFRCRENAIAITKLEESLLWLNKRTHDRIARNVEGTNEL